MEIQTKCPNCESTNLSDGKSDFVYTELAGETLIQFCADCGNEWYIG